MLSQDLVESLGQWLNEYHWDSFWTLTLRDTYSEQAMIRAITRWANKHTIHEPGTMSWLFFLELTKLGAIHAHGLTRHERHSRRHIWGDWFARHGIARGLKYDPDLKAQFYCAKYLTKRQLSWIIDDRVPLNR